LKILFEVKRILDQCILGFLLLLPLMVSGAGVKDKVPDEKFRDGVELYSAGKYTEALEVWKSLYNSGYRSAALDYNIANACFKTNDLPGAILFYERALLLKPSGEDIKYNLEVARTMVVDRFNEVPEIFFVTWFNFISLLARTDTWAAVSIITFILFFILLGLYLFSSRYRLKVASFWIAVFMLLISGCTLAFSLRSRYLLNNSGKAIVFCPQVSGRSSPDEGGNELFLIHEGTKVTITDSLKNWYEIRLPDGNKGWVQQECLEKI